MSESVNYKALYEESERQRQEQRQESDRRYAESERQRQEQRQESDRRYAESERQRKELQRSTTIVRLELEHLRQSKKDTDALVVRQQRELQEMQQKQADQADLHIHPYLALMSRLHAYVSRLVGPARTQTAEPTEATSKNNTTGGRTSIDNKFYPLKMRVWTEFPEQHKRTFSRILAADSGHMPTLKDAQKDEETVVRRLPATAVQMEYFLNETRTAQYIDVAWETPAWHVLRQFLATDDAGHRIHFLSDLGARAEGSAATNSTVSTIASATGSSSNSNSSASSGRGAPSAITLKANPDCVVVALATGAPNRRVAVGEHKPCHALPSAQAAAITRAALPEAYMGRLAREARARRERRRLKELMAEQTLVAQQERADSVEPDVVPSEADEPAARRDGPAALTRQVYFAHAMTQTYHYMLMSGTAFGYIATGETITALHIPDDDPTCLLYHTSVCPARALPDAAADSSFVTAVPPLSASDPADLDALLELPAAQLCSLCVMAYETDNAHRGTEWTADVLGSLALFPLEAPSNASAQRAESPSSLGRRRRNDDDDNDDNNSDDNSDAGGSRSTRRRTLRPPGRGAVSGSQVRTPSPLYQVSSSTKGHSTRQANSKAPKPGARIRKPALPYCTQACLRGLLEGQLLDPKCPNVAYHRRGPSLRGPGVAPDTHRITADQLQELVRDQLLRAPEYDAECLYGDGMGGAIGHLFKITATEYGYTLMAKAVQWQHRRRLHHEERVYGRLRKHQGVLVPVCLGGFRLAVPYPLLRFYRAVTHMLLLSYAGLPVRDVKERQQKQAQGQLAGLQQQSPPPSEVGDDPVGSPVPLPWDNVDIAAETERTMRALTVAGFLDEDDNEANTLWCAETGRVMKIDFDRAHVVPLGAAPDVLAKVPKRGYDEVDTSDLELSDGKRAKHETLAEVDM